jgi:hypothetical protein
MVLRRALLSLTIAAFAGGAFAADVANPDMLLSPAEVRAMVKKAEAGDKEAAERLYIHYDASKSPALAVKWRIAAAKLGDCAATETVLADKADKIAAETRKLAQTYATKFSCKPGDVAKLPTVPVMY